MTVIDIFVDRPSVVPKQKISLGSRKLNSSLESVLMPEIQGCIPGNVLEGDSGKLYSMDANKTSPNANVEAQLIKGKEENTSSSLLYEKQKILVKTNRTPVRSRRKSRWKLKFHHQALPPEYLRHYKQQERKRRQKETNKNNHIKGKNKKIIKKSVSDKEMCEKSQKNGDPEVTIVGMENLLRQEEIVPDSERLKDVEASSSSPLGGPSKHSLEAKRLNSSPQLNLRCRSTDELLNTSITGIPHLDIDVSQNKAFLENLLTNQIEINRVEQKEKKVTDVKNSLTQFNKLKSIKQEDRPNKSFSIPPSGKIMNYSDLPYMGEITLDGIKPRRGRKPKKADICHLIYKNYGQVFPGAPGKTAEEDQSKRPTKWKSEVNNSSQKTKARGGNLHDQRMESPLPTVSGLIDHTEVQNRIINSLLEKRLTQGAKLRNSSLKNKEEVKSPENNEEPLNLCIRDLQSLKIKLSRKHGNFYETKQRDSDDVKIKSEVEDRIKAEVINIDKSESEMESTDENEEEDDLAPFNLVTTELRESSDDDTFLNFNDQITLTRVKPPLKKSESREGSFGEKMSSSDIQMGSQEAGPLLFWPGGFIPGMSSSSFVCCSKTPKGSNFTFSTKEESSQEKKPPKSKNEGHRGQLKRLAPNTNSTKAAHLITKRKRSAIFIPPVPAESTTNPTTEVSICKFKFTGGAKPSLQEKKMLSVDSGGNFRYYSGTGDKSMRGYEYFPRESLQQCQENTGCSPSGVFLTASALGSGEKIPEEIGHSGFFDADFPLQAPILKSIDPKQPKLKTKLKKPELQKRLPDVSCYQTLREHLLGAKSESADVSIIPDDLDREDGNLSDQSGEGFDLRNLHSGYFDGFRIQEETSRMSSKSDESSSRNKKLRRSRKSLAREKLEQTFKEKGFLIQTQQLESAEGATYCKFRQLRKFTRYLFRSWKDYLPGNVRNLSVDAGVENPEMVLDVPGMGGGIKMENLEKDGSERFQ